LDTRRIAGESIRVRSTRTGDLDPEVCLNGLADRLDTTLTPVVELRERQGG
jgi:hypothetical protein